METPAPKPTKGTILCGDDEEAIRFVLRTFLSSSGYKVILAPNGEEAVAAFKEHQEELVAVVLDLRMPKMDGLQAAREIRKLSPDIPLIALSAFLGGGDTQNRYAAKECEAAGFTACMTKPFSIDPFLAVLEESIAKSKE